MPDGMEHATHEQMGTSEETRRPGQPSLVEPSHEWSSGSFTP